MDDELSGAAGRDDLWLLLSVGRFDFTLLPFLLLGPSSPPTSEISSIFGLFHAHRQRWQDHAVAIPCSASRAELFAFVWRKSWTDRSICLIAMSQEVRTSVGREDYDCYL